MFEKLHIKITIFAALIATIYCIVVSESFTTSCITIITTISVFYIISGFITMNLRKYTEELNNQKLSQNTDELEDTENINSDEEDSNFDGINENIDNKDFSDTSIIN